MMKKKMKKKMMMYDGEMEDAIVADDAIYAYDDNIYDDVIMHF